MSSLEETVAGQKNVHREIVYNDDNASSETSRGQ